MKILLMTPLHFVIKIRWIPVGFAYIAANLKKYGHEVQLFDRFLTNVKLTNTEKVNQLMKSKILSFKPDIIGFSTTSPSICDTVDTVRFIRQFYTGIVVAGGHHATAMPELTLMKIPGLDYIVAGEGEIPMAALANGNSPEKIPGIFTRTTNPAEFRPSRTPVLDNLPMPDYSIFDMDYYTSLSSGSVRGILLNTTDIVSSRGCSNNCVYCSETLTYGRGVRFHSPEYTVNVIEKLVKDYGITGMYFHDNDFLISREHAESVCHEMIKRGLSQKIKWSAQSGTNRVDDDILKLMTSAGCVKIEFGMESVNPNHLLGVRKNRSVEMSERAIELCKKHNILVHAYFMTGFKDETLDDLDSLIKWIEKFKPHTFQLGLTKIYPGTQLYQSDGNSFFENSPWTDYELSKYFRTDFFSSITPDARANWMLNTYSPFYKLHTKKALIKTNSMSTLFKNQLKKLK